MITVSREAQAIAHLRAIMQGQRQQWSSAGPDAPGHRHDERGKWDFDGRPCEWCATWAAAEAFLKECEK